MVKKLKKQYETPNEGWSQERINREVQLMEDYGLKNKQEVFKAQSQLRDVRREARKLAASEDKEERKKLLEKANKLGLVKKDSKIEDLLSLNVTDFLNRRLQTAVNRRGHTDTAKEARQLVVHGHVYVDGQRVTTPSYMLTQEEEKKLEVILPDPEEDDEEIEESEENVDEEMENTEDSDEADEQKEENQEETDEEDSDVFITH